jgi:hypothetical protein
MERIVDRAKVKSCTVVVREVYWDGTTRTGFWSGESRLVALRKAAKATGGLHLRKFIRWTPEADAFVVKHYRRGMTGFKHDDGFSAGRIAAILANRYKQPFTKSSVISRWNNKLKGKAHAVSNQVGSEGLERHGAANFLGPKQGRRNSDVVE